MRSWARVCAAVAVLALVTAGCSRVVDGAAQPDPLRPGVAATEDGYGIVVGLPDAPAEVEIYTEPQCEHCADFQARFGEDLRSHLQSGLLAVVYRPLTFLDDEYDTDYSAVAANALFLAAAPSTSASTFQSFVEDLWANQGLALEEFTDDDFAVLARESGVDADVVATIGAGAPGVDAVEMNDANISALSEVTAGPPGTPTVYDVKSGQIVDISDADWLSQLMRAA